MLEIGSDARKGVVQFKKFLGPSANKPATPMQLVGVIRKEIIFFLLVKVRK